MNARQKAKHFKKLYEESLITKLPEPAIYFLPPHYKLSTMIDAKEVVSLQDNPERLKTHIENRILQEIRPLIWDSLKTEKDKYLDKYRYSLDIWM